MVKVTCAKCLCCSLRTGNLTVASCLMVFGAVNFLALFTDLRLDDQPITFRTAISVCDSFYFLVGSLIVHGITSDYRLTIKVAVVLLFVVYFATSCIYFDFFLSARNFAGMMFIPMVLLVYALIAVMLWSYANQIAQ